MSDTTTTQKLLDLICAAVPCLGPLVPEALVLAATHVIVVMGAMPIRIATKLTDFERTQFAERHTAVIMPTAKIRGMYAAEDGPEIAETLQVFDREMGAERAPGSLMVLAAADTSIAFHCIPPDIVQAIRANPTAPSPLPRHFYQIDAGENLMSTLHAEIDDEPDPERRETLSRYVALGRRIATIEASKTPPGNLADALYRAFDGKALETAIEAAVATGVREVFSTFKAAVDKAHAAREVG